MPISNIEYIDIALSIAYDCINDDGRYPFGTIVVKDNKIVGIGKEATRVKNDPTAHSEIEAIRDACKNLNTSNLKGCIVYTSCEPCSMCLSALFWSNIDAVYYACSREDVFKLGFPDRFELIEKRKNLDKTVNLKTIKMIQLKSIEGVEVFKQWKLAKKVSV
ncbi:nucleoside deaminase [Winogradskyella immobilis]|uniref:Nucleoside deaminase n=1 Tax=Winogradskyella immobilis TaxID=2816852 RepID=A0ABS8EQM6_9FLAO|nr:nucleoside deaminase [Winogradskyella immobilis]MCC1485415.1 nucleoside deaminase [Winogradskyella immobilis]MCG0017507.1 nucleoside deaminase [Winogradskyella immobilis]